ncbi:glutamate-5-semialdehyde dehydrogenase [Sandaracinomonas limnophila]|uniref:Gamma-glutamyl phosphate reductase n=1 Tax=Sandaracinomonas limnophila TaxID=1862386 RepID=A0A437PR52_9BACT|nr:glutamate-5-semialdehyde dehydrogenase [Sandaracinomonas limnophila]RVU24718.1 glutamate-5-semialdehyde dehydrogenase [Sandaracinomonas limnophila]
MNTIEHLLKASRENSKEISMASPEMKNQVLLDLANLLEANTTKIILANQKDLDQMDAHNPMRDRLLLNEGRIKALAESVRDITNLADPSGAVLMEKTLKNGLLLKKIAVPLGVVGIIYESRPNVTVDVSALCIRSGNAAVLRGGSDAWHSNSVLVEIIQEALVNNGISKDIVTLLPTAREYVSEFLSATKYVDVIIPRGSDALIQRVRRESLVPTIETGAGVCHTYVAETADLSKAIPVVINAKVSRPSVCNSLDTIVLHKNIAKDFLEGVIDGLSKYNVKIFADDLSFALLKNLDYPLVAKATEEDFGREFLDFACSVKVVNDLSEALNHISNFSSRHSEAIISEDESEANLFLQVVDAAAVYWNASTRFTDGGVFELGAEIGISTQKLHARGPFALEKLVTEKWVLVGDGQTRW